MTAIRPHHAAPRTHVTAALNFVDQGEDDLIIRVKGDADMPDRNYDYRPTDVAIANGRAVPRRPALDWEGFALYDSPTALQNLKDEEAIRTVYYPEVEALIKEKTGAGEVVIFDHTIRSSDGVGTARRSVAHVHNDYTETSAPRRVLDLLGEEEGRERLKGRFIQVNAWRPFGAPVKRAPLALADARSVRPQDLKAAVLDYGDRQGEVYELAYNYGQRWFFFPEMTQDEVILIKGYDSARDGRGRLSPHTAFDDPATPYNAPPRLSMEVRAFAFFNEEHAA